MASSAERTARSRSDHDAVRGCVLRLHHDMESSVRVCEWATLTEVVTFHSALVRLRSEAAAPCLSAGGSPVVDPLLSQMEENEALSVMSSTAHYDERLTRCHVLQDTHGMAKASSAWWDHLVLGVLAEHLFGSEPRGAGEGGLGGDAPAGRAECGRPVAPVPYLSVRGHHGGRSQPFCSPVVGGFIQCHSNAVFSIGLVTCCPVCDPRLALVLRDFCRGVHDARGLAAAEAANTESRTGGLGERHPPLAVFYAEMPICYWARQMHARLWWEPFHDRITPFEHLPPLKAIIHKSLTSLSRRECAAPHINTSPVPWSSAHTRNVNAGLRATRPLDGVTASVVVSHRPPSYLHGRDPRAPHRLHFPCTTGSGHLAGSAFHFFPHTAARVFLNRPAESRLVGGSRVVLGNAHLAGPRVSECTCDALSGTGMRAVMDAVYGGQLLCTRTPSPSRMPPNVRAPACHPCDGRLWTLWRGREVDRSLHDFFAVDGAAPREEPPPSLNAPAGALPPQASSGVRESSGLDVPPETLHALLRLHPVHISEHRTSLSVHLRGGGPSVCDGLRNYAVSQRVIGAKVEFPRLSVTGTGEHMLMFQTEVHHDYEAFVPPMRASLRPFLVVSRAAAKRAQVP